MKSNRRIAAALCVVVILLSGCASGKQSEADQNSDGAKGLLMLESVSLITKVFGDGQKSVALALQYSSDVDTNSLLLEDFQVEGQTITKMYTNSEAATSSEGDTGRFVILEFDYDSSDHSDASSNGGMGGGQGNGPGGMGGEQGGSLDGEQGGSLDGEQGRPSDGEQGGLSDGAMESADGADIRDRNDEMLIDGANFDNQGEQNDVNIEANLDSRSITVTQVGDVIGIDGTICYGSDETVDSTNVINLVVDDFFQFEYSDPETGYTIPYNLYLPENYDESKSYPLLFFMADASVNSEVVTDPLTQGLGAVIWATSEEQAKHECIILAPQYTTTLSNSIGSLTEDDHQWSEGLTLVSNLLLDVIEQYSVDESRIYGTGQSQGCMTNIAISDLYPDLFAAQLLVAGQWDTEEMTAMKDKHLWIVVCEGDNKAYPGMTEATANWQSLGTRIATSEMWDSLSTAEEFDDLVAEMEAQGCNINFTVFSGGNHNYTWTVAYTIEGIRDWIFAQ